MDEATCAEVDAWLTKAQRDLDSATRLLAGNPPYRDTAAYHCQQAAEKALKAFLTAHAHPFPKTHDLTALVKLATEIEPATTQWEEAAVVLTPYATLFRYPDACIEPSDDDAKEALPDRRLQDPPHARESMAYLCPSRKVRAHLMDRRPWRAERSATSHELKVLKRITDDGTPASFLARRLIDDGIPRDFEQENFDPAPAHY